MEPYVLLKFVHVVSAIVAVGFNASYGIWLARAAREPQHLAHVLEGVKTVDNIANAFYGLLLLTGLAMVFVGGLSFSTVWIAAALVLYVLMLVLAIGLYTPAARAQRAALATSGPGSAEYRRLEARSTALGLVLMVIVVAIVFLMVVKPTLA
jgi:uncharacterized membrane protein